MIRLMSWFMGLFSMSYHRGDGYVIVSKNTPLNMRVVLELFTSRSYLEIQKMIDRPLRIDFVDQVEDGVALKVVERKRRHFIRICSEHPEEALARGLDTLWRYLGNASRQNQ